MKERKFLPSLLNSPGRIEEEFGANNTFKPTVFFRASVFPALYSHSGRP